MFLITLAIVGPNTMWPALNAIPAAQTLRSSVLGGSLLTAKLAVVMLEKVVARIKLAPGIKK